MGTVWNRFSSFLERTFLRIDLKLEPHKKWLGLVLSSAGLVAGLLASNLLDFIVKDTPLTPYAAGFLKYALYVIIAILLAHLLYLIFDIPFGPEPKMPAPPSSEREIRFMARPYRRSLDKIEAGEATTFGNLTSSAEKEFEGDTMSVDVVQEAILRGSALGLKVKDQTGRDIGFFDIYHFKSEVLERWVKGAIFEKDLKAEHFEPIAVVRDRGDKTIEFIVGAILMKHKNPVYNFYVGPLLGSAVKRYLSQELAHFNEVILYASLFSQAGRRYSQIFKFEPHLAANQRGQASGGHDVYRASFKPGDRNEVLFANSVRNTYILEVRHD